jgi:uncharacterized membrane protein YuzA (DUF378 family)
MMDARWVVEKRYEMVAVIIYSIVGLAVVTALVIFANYALYSNAGGK